eukprot:13837937-Heterocapsa_arctica.AAC.1
MLDERYFGFRADQTNEVIVANRVRYVDDLTLQSVINTTEGAVARLRSWDTAFQNNCGPANLAQSVGKRQIMACCHGAGANFSASQLRTVCESAGVCGNISNQCKHLGTWLHNRGSNQYELQQRLLGAKRTWRMYDIFWHVVAVSLHAKLTVYRAVITNALLSGLDSC